MLCMYPRNAASSVTPATTDAMASSKKAVTSGISGGLVIGVDDGSDTRRAMSPRNASRAPNPSRPAANEALHTPGGSLLARRFARRLALEEDEPQWPPMNCPTADKNN